MSNDVRLGTIHVCSSDSSTPEFDRPTSIHPT